MIYNTWFISWLFANAFFIVYDAADYGLLFILLLTSLFALPAMIPFAIYWRSLKKRRYAKKQILIRNVIAAILTGFICGSIPIMIIGYEAFLILLTILWPLWVFPVIAGVLAVWLNQNEIYKGLQGHFYTSEMQNVIYEKW